MGMVKKGRLCGQGKGERDFAVVDLERERERKR